MRYKLVIIRNIVALFVVGLSLSSCKDLLDTPLPNDQLATESVFASKATIKDLVNGLYNAYSSQHNGFIVRNNAAISDETTFPTHPGNGLGDLIFANFLPQSTVQLGWDIFYKSIYRANLLIENLPGVPTTVLSESDRKLYLATARFIRAECHFFLLNSYGNVPLVTTTNAAVNSIISQATATEVYASVVSDLEAAIADLPVTVTVTPTIHNKYQAQALLARVYLYMGRWADAETAATSVINSGKFQLVAVLGDVFKKGSPESILSLAEFSTNRLYVNRASLGWMSLPTSAAVTLTTYPYVPDQVLGLIQTGDQRWVNGNWMSIQFTKPYQNKYRHNSSATDAAIAAYPQNYILLRYSEQFLIRAEARMQQNNIPGAAADLNVVRKRAGLPNTTAGDKASMVTAIENERLFELYYEGHRWYDLARTNRLDEVVGKLSWKKDNWKTTYKIWPILDKDLISNPKIKQNPGY